MSMLLNFPRAALWAGILAAAWAAWAAPAAAAPLALAKSFEGTINFVGTQASLLAKSNGNKVCELSSSAEAGIRLPDKASVVSATLYWAGSGPVDPEVSLNQETVSAMPARQFTSTIDGLSYFVAAADVTDKVQGKTAFSFGGLGVSTSATYCPGKGKDSTVLAGFSLVVVYSHASEKYRTVNLYEGLEAMKNSSVTVRMPDYAPRATTGAAGRFGYIVWEGDKTGQQKGDSVSFAQQTMQFAPYAQSDNAFNSRSRINLDENSPGIDFDYFDLATLPSAADQANAVFTTASDRVLLSTAIAALPSQPSDLSILKTQSGEYKVGNEIKYTLTVTNHGTRADGQVKVTDTLPDALAYVSASGTGWTCSLADKTVACSYGKPLPAGSSASVDITARITAAGKISNTAEVSGTADGEPGNNTSTVEGDTGGGQAANGPYVFTVGACKAGEKIGASAACTPFAGPVPAAESRDIHVTRAADGVATPFSATASSTVPLTFALECNNPASAAGVSASYAGAALAPCLDNKAVFAKEKGKTVDLVFAANAPSVKASFSYRDLGIVTLRLLDANGQAGQATFLSKPVSIKASYVRVDGEVANPGTTTLAGAGFAEAGEPFRITVTAYGAGGAALPNFGRESAPYTLAQTLRINVAGNDTEQALLQAQGPWTGSGSGSVAANFVWNEAGPTSLTPRLTGYLDSQNHLQELTYTTVGRFYPAYFSTETELGFDCLKRMACASVSPALARAAYSSQPFRAIVRAFGRNGELQRFTGALVPEVSFIAVVAPGADTRLDVLRDTTADKKQTSHDVNFQLGVPYNATERRTSGWTAPTAIYLRASIPEQRALAAGSKALTITSDRDKDSVEGGMMIVNGRLMLVNTLGSPLVKTPVPLRVQYWSGQAWEPHGAVDEAHPPKGTVLFSGCTRSLRAGGVDGGACDTGVVRLADTGATSGVDLPKIDDGKGVLWLGAVPASASGNVDIRIDGYQWLPSTLGRVTFGQFKSPVIYVREMY